MKKAPHANDPHFDDFKYALWEAVSEVYYEFDGKLDCEFDQDDMDAIMAPFFEYDDDYDY